MLYYGQYIEPYCYTLCCEHMATCLYCVLPVPEGESWHEECKKKYSATQPWQMVRNALLYGHQIDDLARIVEHRALEQFMDEDETDRQILSGFDEAVGFFITEVPIEDKNIQWLNIFLQKFGLTQEELDEDGAFTRLAMALTLQNLENGKKQSQINIDEFDAILDEGETAYWVFPAVQYFRQKAGTTLAAGIMEFIDGGPMIVSGKRIKMIGEQSTLDIPLTAIDDIIFEDEGIIIRSGNKKIEYFQLEESWFAERLLQLLINDQLAPEM